MERVFDDWMNEMNERVDDVMGRHVTTIAEGEEQHCRNGVNTSIMGERHEEENVMMKCDNDNDQQQQHQQQQQHLREQRWHNRSLACQTGRKHVTLVRLPLPYSGAHTHWTSLLLYTLLLIPIASHKRFIFR